MRSLISVLAIIAVVQTGVRALTVLEKIRDDSDLSQVK
jgi:hypothetical protein